MNNSLQIKSEAEATTLEDLVEKYGDMIYRLALSYTANRADSEDILQEVFLRYYKKKPIFLSDEHEKAWFIRVTINCGKTCVKSLWKQRTVLYDNEEISVTYDTPFYNESEVLNAVMTLKPKQRICIYLHYYEDMSIKDIALKTGINESTVKSHLYRAKIALEKKLERFGECYVAR